MPWVPDLIDDPSQAIDFISDTMTLAEAEINDLSEQAFRRGAINITEAPSIIAADSAMTVRQNVGEHLYSSAFYGAWLLWVNDGADGALEGAFVAPGAGDERIVIGQPDAVGGKTLCKVTFPGSGLLLGNLRPPPRVTGILISLNLEVVSFTSDEVDPDGADFTIVTGLQYEVDGNGTFRYISSSERFMSLDTRIATTSASEKVYIDVPTVTFMIDDQLTDDGLDPSVNRVTSIRGVFTIKTPGAFAYTVTLGRHRLSALPIMCSESV